MRIDLVHSPKSFSGAGGRLFSMAWDTRIYPSTSSAALGPCAGRQISNPKKEEDIRAKRRKETQIQGYTSKQG